MNFFHLKKNQWVKGDEWYWKWYDTELCARALGSYNPLVELGTHQFLESIVLNNEWFYNKRDLESWINNKHKILSKGGKSLNQIVKLSTSHIQQTEYTLRKAKNSSAITPELFEEIKYALLLLWQVFLIDFGDYLEKPIKNVLQKNILTQSDIELINKFYFSLDAPLAHQKALKDLTNIAQYIKLIYKNNVDIKNPPEEIKKCIYKFLNRYAWLPYDKPDSQPYTYTEVLEQLQSLLTQEIHPIKNSALPRNIQEKLTRKQTAFLQIIKRHIFLDNYAADIYGRLDYLLQKYFVESFDVSFKELTWYTFGELEKLYNTHKPLSTKELSIRRQYRVMIFFQNQLSTHYGKFQYYRYKNFVSHTSQKKYFMNQLYGMCAFPGRAKV